MKTRVNWIFALMCAACAIAGHAGEQAQVVKPGYPILAADVDTCEVTRFSPSGEAVWTYAQVKPIDAWPMGNGEVLMAYLPSPRTANKGGVRLVNAEKQTIFDLPFDDEIMSCQPLPNGNMLVNECGAGRISEMDRQGRRLRSFEVKAKGMGHRTARLIRLTAQNTVLVAECYSHKLREYDFDGRMLKEWDLPMAYGATRLPNGNTLISGYKPAALIEVAPSGETVWTLTANELPGELNIAQFGEAVRLHSGNTLVACCSRGVKGERAVMFEVTPAKSVVWKQLEPSRTRETTSVKPILEPAPSPVSNPAPAVEWLFDTGLDDTSAAFRLSAFSAPDRQATPRLVDAAEAPGVSGKALALGVADADATFLSAPLSDAARLGARYSIEAWIWPTALAEWNRLVLNWGKPGQYAYHLALRNGQASIFHCQINGKFASCEGGVIQLRCWQQIVAVAARDESNPLKSALKLYLNGKLIATVPFDGTAAETATEPLVIGDSAGCGSPGLRYRGFLDSVALWKRPLSDAEIAARFDARRNSLPPPIAEAQPDEIIFCERNPGRDYQGHYYANFGYDCGDENHWLHGADGGRLAIYNPKTGSVRTLLEDARGAIRDPQIHYEGKKVLFSYRKGGAHHYNLYEMNLDGTDPRQITRGDWDDVEPAYLPDGGIAFCSTRCKRYVLCWLAPVAVLFRCNADGSGLRQLSSNNVSENTPAVLPDGRILYTRWEYVNRDAVSFHHLWTMNPDGTGVMVYYGNMYPGGVFIDAQPIAGTGNVIFVDSGYHGQLEHTGKLMLLSLRNGPDDRTQARAITGDGFRDPYPLSERQFLAARGREIVTVMDDGKVTTLWKSDRMVHEPRPIAPHSRQPVIPSRVDLSQSSGTLMLTNVYEGRNMDGVKPGSIKKLLVMEDLPKPVNFHGGGTTPLAHGGSWTFKRILGTVPVEADGSANFEVPSCRSIYVAALGENDLCVKQMRSFVTVQPGEHVSCIGCHENRTVTPRAYPGVRLAYQRAPSQIQPFAGIPEILDFPRDIQPILDRHCISCHDVANRKGGLALSGDRGPTYSLAYYNLFLYRQIKDHAGLNWEGIQNIGGRPGGNDAPYSAFSSAAPLMKYLEKSHYEVKLSEGERTTIRLWLDSATPYAGTAAAFGTGQIGGWWRSNEPVREMADAWPTTGPAKDAIQRRCTTCHESRLPRFVTDLTTGDPHNDFEGWMRPVSRFSRHTIFNLTHPERSLALTAPLAKSAGGFAEGALPKAAPVPVDLSRAPKPVIHGVVFASTDDPDYRAILAHLQAARDRLSEIKRFDMPGFTPAPAYIREMKRYGILPAEFDAENKVVNTYDLDREYWRQFWHQPIKPAE